MKRGPKPEYRTYPAGRKPLTAAQDNILRLAGYGLSYSEIGVWRDVSESTVKAMMHNVYSKLGAHSLIDALTAVGWLVVPDMPPRRAAGRATSVLNAATALPRVSVA